MFNLKAICASRFQLRLGRGFPRVDFHSFIRKFRNQTDAQSEGRFVCLHLGSARLLVPRASDKDYLAISLRAKSCICRVGLSAVSLRTFCNSSLINKSGRTTNQLHVLPVQCNICSGGCGVNDRQIDRNLFCVRSCDKRIGCISVAVALGAITVTLACVAGNLQDRFSVSISS